MPRLRNAVPCGSDKNNAATLNPSCLFFIFFLTLLSLKLVSIILADAPITAKCTVYESRIKCKVIVIEPSDVSLKTTDVVEKIISGIVEAGEVDVVGINEAMFLVCSAINMATEIAKVYVDDILHRKP